MSVASTDEPRARAEAYVRVMESYAADMTREECKTFLSRPRDRALEDRIAVLSRKANESGLTTLESAELHGYVDAGDAAAVLEAVVRRRLAAL